MNQLVKFLQLLYRFHLHLYPASIRSEYASEMKDTFQKMLEEAQSQGLSAVLMMLLREVRDLPKSVLTGSRFVLTGKKGGTMTTIGESSTIHSRVPRSSWAESLLVLGPFLSITLLFLVTGASVYLENLRGAPLHFNWNLGFLIVYMLELLLFSACLFKGFLRASIPYWFFMLVMTIILFGIYAESGVWYAWLGLLPFPLVVLLWLVVPGARKNYAEFSAQANRDWTLISFILFGNIPLWYGLLYNQAIFSEVLLAGCGLLFAAGALMYMRSSTYLQRILSLAGSLMLAQLLMIVHLLFYGGAFIPGGVSSVQVMAVLLPLAVLLFPSLLGPVTRKLQGSRAV